MPKWLIKNWRRKPLFIRLWDIAFAKIFGKCIFSSANIHRLNQKNYFEIPFLLQKKRSSKLERSSSQKSSFSSSSTFLIAILKLSDSGIIGKTENVIVWLATSGRNLYFVYSKYKKYTMVRAFNQILREFNLADFFTKQKVSSHQN